MKKQCLLLYFLFSWCCSEAQDLKTENVILVTFDGLRWNEVFTGADKRLLRSEKYSNYPGKLQEQYWHNNPNERRRLLMPFFWNTLAAEGQLIGNRRLGNKMNMTSRRLISYPGYNELLNGFADPNLKHNRKVYNPNVTILEWAHRQPEFRHKVAVVGSWNVFPYIINTKRSGIPVNAGNMLATGDNLTEKELQLNEQLSRAQPRWASVRQDTLTYQYAIEYLKRERPRLLHLAFGETDEHAHEGNYADYLYAIKQSDAMIQELWEWLQSQEQYRNKTTLIVATDHGRGTMYKSSWRKHGRTWHPGSSHVWMAVIGPDTPPEGEVKAKKKYYQHQIAGMIAYYLGLPFSPHQSPGAAIADNL